MLFSQFFIKISLLTEYRLDTKKDLPLTSLANILVGD